MRNSRL